MTFKSICFYNPALEYDVISCEGVPYFDLICYKYVVCCYLFGGRFNYLVTLKTQVLNINSTGVRLGTQLHYN